MIIRQCVRGLIEDDSGHILLMSLVEPETARTFWITPGGGVEASENDHSALERELGEETGLFSFEFGRLIWTRDFTFQWSGETFRQLERFYWIQCEAFEAAPTRLQGTLERSSFGELRWWSVDEIEASDATFAPLDLALQIKKLRENPLSTEVIELGS